MYLNSSIAERLIRFICSFDSSFDHGFRIKYVYNFYLKTSTQNKDK